MNPWDYMIALVNSIKYQRDNFKLTQMFSENRGENTSQVTFGDQHYDLDIRKGHP